MSLPPPVSSGPINPNYDYGNDPYSVNTIRQNDTYGQPAGYESPEVQSYAQQLIQYYQMYAALLQQMPAGDPRRDTIMQYEGMVQQFYQEATGQAWDPTALGGVGMGGTPGMPGTAPSNGMGVPTDGSTGDPTQPGISFPIDFQDSTHIVSENGSEFDYTFDGHDTETRAIDAYQENGVIVVPNNAAQVKIVQDADGTKEVTLTDPATGLSKTIRFHGKNLKIEAANKDNVTQDASVTGGVKVVDLSDAQNQPAGDPPTSTDGDTAKWDTIGDVNISPYYTNNTVEVKGNVTITPNSNEEYYTVEYQKGPPAEYQVKVYDDPTDRSDAHLTNTFTIDAQLATKINFGCDPSRITFLNNSDATLADPSDPTGQTINSTDPNAQKLAFLSGTGNAGGAGQAVSPMNPNDTPADSVSGTTATYNTSSTVDLHADFTQTTVNTYNITCPGSVTVHGSSYSDTFEIKSYDAGPPQKWTILVHKDGKTDAADTQAFNITGGANTTLNLDAMDPSVVTDDTGGAGLSSVNIGTGSADGSGGNGPVDTSGDTQPSNKQGKDWSYNQGGDVTLSAAFDHDTSAVNNAGTFTLNFSDPQTVAVSKNGNQYTFVVTDPKTNKKETFTVTAKSVNLNGPEANVSFMPAQNDQNAEQDLLALQTDPNLNVQGQPVSQIQPSINFVADVLTRNDFGATIPGNNEKHGELGGEDSWISNTINDISKALTGKLNWSEVQADLNKMGTMGDGEQNDYAEELFQEMTVRLGGGSSGRAILATVLAQMPSSVKSTWTKYLGANQGELNNNDAHDHGGAEDGWTHQQTIDFINSASGGSGS